MVWGHRETWGWNLSRAVIEDRESCYRFHVAFMADAYTEYS